MTNAAFFFVYSDFSTVGDSHYDPITDVPGGYFEF